MKQWLCALLLIPTVAFSQTLYNWKVYQVTDGDTIKFSVDFLPAELKPYLALRIRGVDTPEKPPLAQCKKEADLAKKATEFTKNAVKQANSLRVELFGWDKYGGRVLGDLFIDGKRLSDMLIDNHLARPYYGGIKRSWCD